MEELENQEVAQHIVCKMLCLVRREPPEPSLDLTLAWLSWEPHLKCDIFVGQFQGILGALIETTTATTTSKAATWGGRSGVCDI